MKTIAIDFNEKCLFDFDAQAKEVLEMNGYTVAPGLNHCTACGVDFWIGYNGIYAAVAAIMFAPDSLYFIDKIDLRIMAETAKTYGIKEVELFTNYGIELHSKHEKPEDIGFSKITKIIQP